MKQIQREKIAIVGTGISALAAAWGLYQHHEITVFESADHIGGHSNTVDIKTSDGKIPVDTGFIVYNEVNYPNLTALFDRLGVKTIPSSMSFSASLDGGRFEYTGSFGRSILARSPLVLQFRAWKMCGEIIRLFTHAKQVLTNPALSEMTLGEYLKHARFSGTFTRDHLLPMCAAIWSCPADVILNYPAVSFFRFFDNHGLFKFNNRPQWRTVKGGAQEYVKKLITPFKDQIYTGRGAKKICRNKTGVLVTDTNGRTECFDQVVLGCHADEALQLLEKPTELEQKTLGVFSYQRNLAVLHTDVNLMPKSKGVWSSWNYIEADAKNAGENLCVSYWMNELQSLPTRDNIFLTLNPVKKIAPEKMIQKIWYDHPIFNLGTLKGQKTLPKIQGRNRTWFCGAYFGYGFHEDGLQAGLAVAESLTGVLRPWIFDHTATRIAWHGGKVPVAKATM